VRPEKCRIHSGRPSLINNSASCRPSGDQIWLTGVPGDDDRPPPHLLTILGCPLDERNGSLPVRRDAAVDSSAEDVKRPPLSQVRVGRRHQRPRIAASARTSAPPAATSTGARRRRRESSEVLYRARGVSDIRRSVPRRRRPTPAVRKAPSRATPTDPPASPASPARCDPADVAWTASRFGRNRTWSIRKRQGAGQALEDETPSEKRSARAVTG
jgi:hypothetical protein